MNKPGFLVLAAGSSQRFGSNKLLTPLPSGDCLLSQTLQKLPGGYDVHVVCHPHQQPIHSLLQNLDASFAANPAASSGMASSIVHGIQQTSEWQGWVICLADMPWINTGTYRQIVTALKPDNIVVPCTEHRGQWQRGNPVAFGSMFRPALLALTGSRGARSIVSAHPDRVHELSVKDHGILLDIDYPDDINKHAND